MGIELANIDFELSIIDVIFERADSDDLVVLPTNRSINKFISKYSGIQSVPNIFTYVDFFDTILDAKGYTIADAIHKLIYLREALYNTKQSENILHNDYEALKNITKLNTFIESLSAFYQEIDENMVDFSDMKRVSLYSDYQTHVDILSSVYESYNEILKRHKLVDKNYLKYTVSIKNPYSGKHIYIAVSGFLTKFEIAALKKISKDSDITLFIQVDKSLDKIDEVYSAFGKKIPKIKYYPYQNNIDVYKFPTKSQMAGWVVDRVRYELNSKTKPENIAVILPDESLNVILRAIDRRLFNFAEGFPLKESVYFTFFDDLLKLLQNRNRYGYESKDVLGIINHPFTNVLIDRKYKENLLEKAYKIPLIEKKDIEYILNTDEINKFIKIYESKTISVHKASLSLLQICKNIALKYDTKHPDYGSAKELFFSELERLSCLNEQYFAKYESGENILKYILFLLSKKRYPDIGMGEVHCLGVLETRLLDFDVVIVPSINDGIFPKRSSKDLFLNTQIRQMLALPTTTDRESLQKLYMNMVFKRAKRVYLAYEENDNATLSPYLSDMIYKKSIKVKSLVGAGRYIFDKEHYKKTVLKQPKNEIEKDSAVMDKLSSMIFSPHSINTYKKCGLAFYYRYIAGLKKEIEIGDEDIFGLGNIVHKTMQEIYKSGKPINSEKELEKQFEDVFKRLISSDVNLQFNEAEKLKAEYFLYRIKRSDFFKYESLITPNLIRTEEELKTEYRSIQMKGRADRIDEYDDRIEIIDYKTSSIEDKIRIKDAYNVQLPMYRFFIESIMGDSREIITCYYDLHKRFKKIKPVYDYSAFKDDLNKTVDEIFDVNRNFEANPKHCKWCEFRYLCQRLNI